MADGLAGERTAPPLIRDEVTAARQASALGSVRIATPLSATAIAVLGTILVTGLVVWLFAGHYTRRIHVDGSVQPLDGVAPISATSPGVVTKLLVHEGQHVPVGTPLLVISQETIAESLGDTRKAISADLRRSQASLSRDIASNEQLEADQVASLGAQHDYFVRQLSEIDAQIKVWRASSDRQSAILDRIHTKLPPGVVSEVQLQQLQSQQDSAVAQIASLSKDRLQLQQQIADNEAQRRQLPIDSAQKRRDFERKILDSRQLLVQSESGRLLVIRSEIAGVVTNLLVHPGQTVAAGKDLLTVLPQGARLHAELLVPSDAVGFLEQGNHVVIHYAAFSYQKFGPGRGVIASISPNALSADESAQISGQQQKTSSMYRVMVDLDSQSVTAYGKPRALASGMNLDADILIERRRMIEWVFEPLYGMARR